MDNSTVIDRLLLGRPYELLRTEDPQSLLYWYASQRLSYFLLIDLAEHRISIGVDALGGVPFGANSLFEVVIQFDDLSYHQGSSYGRPCLIGTCQLVGGTNLTVIEIMVRDDGDLIIWPQGFMKNPASA